MGETHGGTLEELLDWLSSPPSDYGNHSCDECISNSDCPVRHYVQDTSIPNSCSFYWPPNAADQSPTGWYWRQLRLIAMRQSNRKQC